MAQEKKEAGYGGLQTPVKPRPVRMPGAGVNDRTSSTATLEWLRDNAEKEGDDASAKVVREQLERRRQRKPFKEMPTLFRRLCIRRGKELATFAAKEGRILPSDFLEQVHACAWDESDDNLRRYSRSLKLITLSYITGITKHP